MRVVKKLYRRYIKAHLTLSVQQAIGAVVSELRGWLVGWKSWLRVQRPVTRILGLEYHLNRRYIIIDITYACNLHCHNCNRSCTQAPTQEQMTVAQIRRFLDMSIASNVRWECIRILGGEPTLHPDLLEIIDMLRSWRLHYAPEAEIGFDTNGYGRKVRKVLRLIPDDVKIKNSGKKDPEPLFKTFNIAPADLIAYRFADFRNGCNALKKCGMGLTPYGFYPCSIAGGIDRVFGFGAGRDKLPTEDDDMYDLLEKFCHLCGHFERRYRSRVHRPVMSAIWKASYQRYHDRPPVLPQYGDMSKDDARMAEKL
jgi:hypothetical protein